MHTQGRYILSTSMPAVILRLLIVLTIVLSSLSINIQNVSADDNPTTPDGEEIPTTVPTEDLSDSTPEPTLEAATEPTEAATDDTTAGSICFALTISHIGYGVTPTAFPENSEGCEPGKYTEGEVIDLSGASPDEGWEISGWSGTDHDASAENSNALTMPANNHDVSVIYSEIEIVEAQDDVEAETLYSWRAFNDSYVATGEPSTNITSVALSTASSSNALKKYSDGTTISGVTFTVAVNSITAQNSDDYGGEAASGTDAYNTFHGIAQLIGGGKFSSGSSYVYITFSGLDPTKTYTFTTTANRNDSDYTARITKFMITDATTATNASTSGVTKSTTNFTDDGTTFCTGYNYTNGYVARWTGIQPGSDGDFQIQATNVSDTPTTNQSYIPAVFMLAEENTTTTPTIEVSGSLNAFTSSPGVASDEQSYSVEAINLTENLTITAPADFEISTTSGSNFGSSITLTPESGSVPETMIYVHFLRAEAGTSSGTITHTSGGAEEIDLDVSGTASNCTTVNLVATEDTYMSSVNTTNNYGATNLFKVSSYSSSNRGTLIRWDLSSIPTTATVSNASLTFYVSSAASQTYNLYNMRRDWVEGSNNGSSGSGASWTYYGAGTGSWGTSGAANTSSDRYDTNLWGAGSTSFSTTGSKTLDLNSDGISVVQGWVNGGLNNYGLTIQNYSAGSSSNNDLQISSSENTTVANRPQLNVTYCSGSTTTHTLTVGNDGNGSVTLSPSGGTYVEGTTVKLTPVANSGYVFSSWSGINAGDVVSNGDGTYSIVMSSDKVIYANFIVGPTCSTVNLEAAEDTYMSSYNKTYNYGGVNLFKVTNNSSGTNRGALIKWDLSSIPSNATISSASVSVYVSTSSSATYNMYAMRRSWIEGILTTGAASSTSANWNTYDGSTSWGTLGAANTSSDRYDTNLWSAGSTSFSSTGSKEVSLNSSGIAVIQQWVAGSLANYGVTLQNYSTTSGSDDLQISSSEHTSNAGPTLNITYCISATTYTLTAGNDGNGSVSLSPSGGTYETGTIVTLTPVPNSGYVFNYWSGTDAADITDNGNGTYSITMDEDKSISANFATTTLKTLSITTNGNGTVSLNPSGGAYEAGTVVTLTPAANSGYIFSSWSGANAGEVYDNLDGSYSISMDGNKVLVANFAVIPQYTLTVSTSGTGSVTLSPTGGTYDANTIVTLTPVAGTNYMFGSWSGTNAADVTDNLNGTYSITMNAAKAVTANFIITNNAPNVPVLVKPADAATGVSTSPTLEITVSDPEADAMDVTFYGRATGDGTGEDFTLIAIPDTQNLVTSSSGAAIFNTATQWIVNNKTTDNIVFTTHLGDIVNSSSTSESQYADAAMDILDAGNVAYSVGPGNHDLLSGTLYNTYFGSTRFSGKSFYQGYYTSGGDNYNNYSFFSAGGMDFIIINLQYYAGSGALDWADGLLKTHSSKRAIVVQHDILNTSNGWTNQTTYNSLKDNPNLFMMLCGHMHTSSDGAGYLAGAGDSGQTIHVIMTDYQDFSNGYVKILEFQPSNDEIVVRTYSPDLNSYRSGSEEAMTLEYGMDTVSPFEEIGTVSDIASGDNASITWDSLANETEYEWYVVATDGTSDTISDTWSFTTSGTVPNNDPVITESDPQAVSMSEDGAPTPFSLTLHASDSDGDTLTWSIASDGVNGNASASGSGISKTIGYQPDGNFSGTDSFVVQVSDGKGGVDTITVNVTINPVNDAPVANAQTVNTSEDTSKAITLTGLDIEESTLSYTVLTQPSNGALSSTAPNLTYTPDGDYNGSDSFTFKVNDGSLDSSAATVTINITAVNDALVITEGANTSVSMSEDSDPTEFELTLHATDVDSGTLTWSILMNASSGDASASGIGSLKEITYTPDEDYNGSDSFVVQVSDGSAADTITVNVNISAVNDAPVANAQSVTTEEDTPKAITLSGSDIENSSLSYIIATQPQHGALSGDAPNLTYTPVIGYNGSDSFTFKVNDGELDSNTATVSISITNINHLPVISGSDPRAVSISEDNYPIAFDLTLSASDIDEDILTWSISSPASHGSASASGSGSSKAITYTPYEDYNGSDSFIVKVSDGNGGEDTVTVNVTINAIADAPLISEADPQTVSMSEDGSPTAFSLTLHATDVDEDTLTWSIASPAASGTASAEGTGDTKAIGYEPNADFSGSDSFVVQVTDGSLVDTITVNVTIEAVNDAPLCQDVSLSTFINTQGQTAPDCSDVDDISLTYSIVSQPAHGTGSVVSDLLTYMPSVDYSGADSFTYQATDGEAISNIAGVTVEVSESNHAPVCNATSLTTEEDTQGQTDPLCSDDEVDPLTYSISAQPTHGSAAVMDGQLVYTPTENYHGPDSFAYSANDGLDDSEAVAVTITVNAVNDAPVCAAASLGTYKNTLGWADPACTDVEGDTLTYAIASQPAHGAASVRSGRLRYIPAYNFYGADTFTYQASDGADLSNAASVAVTVSSASLATRAPTVPAPAAPASRALLIDLTPRFDWGSSRIYSGTAFDFYQLQAASDAAFAHLVIDQEVSGLANSEFTPSNDLSENTRYYWRVRAFNSLGQFSAWSSVRYFREAMPSPVLMEMSGGIYLDNLRPTFDWEDVSGAASYTFQIATKPNMSGASGTTVASSTYIPGKDLSKNKSLYYRVRANGENGPSTWSETFSVITPNTPSTPKLSLPKNKALLTDLTPRLDWSNTVVPSGVTFDHYEVQIATDAAFSALVLDQDVSGLASNSEFTLTSDLSPNTRYYWRVRAFNTLDQYSSWSTVSYFREAMLAPVLASPASGTALDNLRPAFDWQDVEGAAAYTVQISSSASMSGASSTKVTDSAYTPAKDLSKNKTLYWRVRAEGENGPSDWCEVWSVVTPNTPTTPALTSPANKALLTERLPRLDWSNSSVPAGIAFDHYQVQLAADAAFTSLVLDEDVEGLPTDSEFTLYSELSPNTLYYWRVRAYNTLGQYSSWSAARYFREAMDAPELLSPVYGAIVTSLKPAFDWEDVAGAAGYSIQLSSSASMSGASTYSTTNSTYTPAKNLGANKSYYWRVRAVGVNGPSEWSEVRLLVTPGS